MRGLVVPLASIAVAVLALLGSAGDGARAAGAVTLSIDAAANRRPINPDIYGVSWASPAQLQELNVPLNRQGGNAATRFNWQDNCSNRGSDWYFESIADGPAVPGGYVDDFIGQAMGAKVQPAVTIPIIGWVARVGPGREKLASFSIAKYGPQTDRDWQWFGDAGNGISAANGQPITGNDPNDANQRADSTFQQGWVQHLIGKWGGAGNGGVRHYILDNEPSIWHITHRDVQPTGATMAQVRDRMADHALKVKQADAGALIWGPEEWGWSGYFYSGYDQQWGSRYGWNNLPDRAANGGADYLPWLLGQLRQRSETAGVRLLDYFTVHFYPQGGEFSGNVDPSMQLLRNRSTRALWDPNYGNESWIGTQVALIPRLKRWVAEQYPGTKTGLTEYNWGAEQHMNGATTQADIWGIFGREGLDLAARWVTPDSNTPTYRSMLLYRNYDGKKSTFGETSVRATAPDPDTVSSFAAERKSDGALTVMVINKQLSTAQTVTVNLANFAPGTAIQVWQLAGDAPITRRADLTPNGSSFTTTVPAQSITHFIVPAGTTPPPSTASAQFVGIDSTTQGTWKGVYGADGYQLVGDGTQLPAYAQVSITGATTHLWGVTDLVQGLQRATEPGRIAACWYAPDEFTVNLNLTDGQVHRVAFYSLDFDWNNARAQRVEVLDAATGAVLDSRSLTDYALGKYLVWNLKGNLKLRFIRTGFANSVLSGLFFGGASTPGTPPPGAPTQLTATSGNGQVALAWTGSAGATSYTVKRGTASGGPYTAVASGLTGTAHTDTGLTNGTTYYYVVTATGPGGESGPSNQASATPTAPPAGGSASAQFVGSDSTTQGTWKGVYGAEGYQLVGDRTQLPAYAQVGITGAASHVWGYPEVPQALQRGTDPGRIAACWYAPDEFTVNLNLTDGQVHRVAFYCLDYDWNNARAQRVEVLDAATGAVLDSRSLQDYSLGKYLVWNLKGNLKLRFIRTGFTNSVLSGLFFGPAGTVSPPAAPASLTATAGDRQVALSWSASTGATSYTVKRGTTSGGPYTAVASGITAATYTDTGLTNGTAYYYVVTATGPGGESGPSNQASATPTAPPTGGSASAQFVGLDSTTQGTWKGVYGADGYQMVGDATLLPAYAQLSLTGAATHVWGGTDLVQGLQRATEPGRVAACWYAPDEFTVNLNLTDGQVHRVAFYCLDFDWNNARAQRVEVLDAATGAVLDSRSLQDYSLGKYLVWNLKGNLKLRFLRTGFTNSVLSGVFFN